MSSLLGIALLLPLLLLFATPSWGDSETEIGLDYLVLCEDLALKELFVEQLSSDFEEHRTSGAPVHMPATLILMVNQNVNSNINPGSVSIAVVHASLHFPFALAHEMLTQGGDIPETLMQILVSHGIVEHVNVAHIDQATSESAGRVVDELTEQFFLRYSP